MSATRWIAPRPGESKATNIGPSDGRDFCLDHRLTDTLRIFRAKDAVAAMIKRLAHRNANVQLYTLEVRSFALDSPVGCTGMVWKAVHYRLTIISLQMHCLRTVA